MTPEPDRIIWLYKRWQPLYTEMKSTIHPPIEFVRGIPIDLEKDSFLNPKVHNVIVLDDLMSVAGKDPRVTDLFTEGSHHRNLSVIAINQNLYNSKDPTQRRNCHYIALFNNPVDQQPVLTLARQMYPRRSQRFMDAYERAVAKPYGYLLVDLKPTTPSDRRLVPNGLTEAGSDSDLCRGVRRRQQHTPKRLWLDSCGSSSDDDGDNGNEEDCHPRTLQRMFRSRHRSRKQRRMPCPDCGLILTGGSNFIRHVLEQHAKGIGASGPKHRDWCTRACTCVRVLV